MDVMELKRLSSVHIAARVNRTYHLLYSLVAAMKKKKQTTLESYKNIKKIVNLIIFELNQQFYCCFSNIYECLKRHQTKTSPAI